MHIKTATSIYVLYSLFTHAAFLCIGLSDLVPAHYDPFDRYKLDGYENWREKTVSSNVKEYVTHRETTPTFASVIHSRWRMMLKRNDTELFLSQFTGTSFSAFSSAMRCVMEGDCLNGDENEEEISSSNQTSTPLILVNESPQHVNNDDNSKYPGHNANALYAPSTHSPSPPANQIKKDRNDLTSWGGMMHSVGLLASLVAVYGLLTCNGRHLLPFFVLLSLELVASIIRVMNLIMHSRGLSLEKQSYLTYNKPVRRHAQMLVLIGFFIVLCLKAYLLSVVWKCYRFLTIPLRPHLTRTGEYRLPASNSLTLLSYIWAVLVNSEARSHRLESHLGDTEMRTMSLYPHFRDTTDPQHSSNGEADNLMPSYNCQPPAYEEIIKLPSDTNMPPSYSLCETTSNLPNTSAETVPLRSDDNPTQLQSGSLPYENTSH